MKKILLQFAIFLVSATSSLFAQNNSQKKSINITGNIGLFYDIYDFTEENYPNFRAKYPENLLRLNANATIQLGKHFSIPFGINITNQKTLYNLPNLPNENIVDFIQNPKNNISIHPKYKWIQAHIGTHTPNYSELTTGDINIFGAGIDLNPGKLIFSFNYGISQRAIEQDNLLNTVGAYAQKIIATRIGFGKIDGSKFTINIVKIEDDVTSLINAPTEIKPIEGITLAPLIEVKFGKKLFFTSETAVSIFTSNLLNPFDIDNEIVDAVKDIITINASSKGDFSHKSSLEWKSKKFTLGGEVKYIGPGFVPVGFRNIEKDILDYKFKSSIKLFKGKTTINGMFGIRTNNLKNTTLQSTKRVISNLNIFTKITKKLSLNASYSNFGFNNNEINNVLRIEMINNTYTISPSYKYSTASISHLISLNWNMNNFDQFDTSSASFEASQSKSYGLNYNLFFKNMPLNINFMGLHLNNQTPASSFKMKNYSASFSYKLFDKKIRPTLLFNLANISKNPFTSDKRFSTKIKVSYKINKKLQFKFAYKLNKYTYGTSRPNALTKENRLQFSLLKKF